MRATKRRPARSTDRSVHPFVGAPDAPPDVSPAVSPDVPPAVPLERPVPEADAAPPIAFGTSR